MKRYYLLVVPAIVAVVGATLLVENCRSKSGAEDLVQQGDITFERTFAVPTGEPEFGPTDLAQGGQAISLLPGGQSLYFGCHSTMMYARISIPQEGGAATLLDECVYVPEEPGNGSHLGGTFAVGDKLITSKYVFYDGNSAAWWTHQYSTDGGKTWSPMVKVGELNAGFYAGYMGPVPPELQGVFGPAFTGQGILSIIGRTSSGPAAFGFDPSRLGVDYPVPARPWVYYPLEHPLSNPDVQNDLYTRSDQLGGGFFVPGTRSFLFIGKHGYGPICYGQGVSDPALHGKPNDTGMMQCYDPLDGAQGEHTYPYRGQVWAYNIDEFAAVLDGDKQPWEVKPYAWWPLPGVSEESYRVKRGGTAFDPETGHIYVTEDFGTNPKVEVFRLQTRTPPPSANTTYDCTMELTGGPTALKGTADCKVKP